MRSQGGRVLGLFSSGIRHVLRRSLCAEQLCRARPFAAVNGARLLYCQQALSTTKAHSSTCMSYVSCSVRLAPRATHTTCLDVADIEGAHPGSRDRSQLFAACKAASESASAQQKAAQAALTGLQLHQRELLQLWSECSRMDRDKSGYVTGRVGCAVFMKCLN